MTWTRLIYGTAVCAALVGTAIYYSAPRVVIKSIDIVELHEAAYERLMPFGYTLATNTAIYDQATWTVDPSTNRWQLGSNQMPYLIFAGFTTVTDRFIAVDGISQSGTSLGGFDEYLLSGIPDPEYVYPLGGPWTTELSITGRTMAVDAWTGRTNELPAYVLNVHPRGVGVYNNKITLDLIDSILLGVIPRYVDHEASVNGVFTNASIPMLTVSSVWARLDLPFVWTNITKTASNVVSEWVDSWTNAVGVATNETRLGTNQTWSCSTNISTNYTFTTGPLCTTNMLWERYRVAQYLKWTQAPRYVNIYPHPRAAYTWSNVVSETWTLSTNQYAQDVAFVFGSYERWEYSDDHPPSYPDWYDQAAKNGPPSDWFSPSQSIAIDDLEIGALTTNLTSNDGAPFKTFESVGTLSKAQSYSLFWNDTGGGSYHWDWDFRYNWVNAYESLTTKQRSRPAVRVPCNTAGITVTGDVYFVKTATILPNSLNSMIVTNYSMGTNITVDMTATGSSVWVGAEINLTDDLFPATNLMLTASIITQYRSEAVSWSCGWSVPYEGYTWPLTVRMRATDVVFKWSFTRCPP